MLLTCAITRHPFRWIAGLLAAAGCISACQSPPGSGDGGAKVAASTARLTVIPRPGETIRAGGDMDVRVSGKDGDYRSGACSIDTPLPSGYPAPTPPGAIDLKSYPSVRLAEVSGKGDPDDGMNAAFWPLFNHIKKHDIAMTSPVEMNYTDLGSKPDAQPKAWSMAFLYRTPELNTTGAEGKVVVRDSAPVTVVAVGMKGDYSMSLVERGVEQIEAWLAANPGWEPAGEWRSLYYNGPSLFYWNKWAEVQLPVRPRAGAAVQAPGKDPA